MTISTETSIESLALCLSLATRLQLQNTAATARTSTHLKIARGGKAQENINFTFPL